MHKNDGIFNVQFHGINLDLKLHKCYSSVKYKSTLLNCPIKIIKSAPKQKRYYCFIGRLGKGS